MSSIVRELGLQDVVEAEALDAEPNYGIKDWICRMHEAWGLFKDGSLIGFCVTGQVGLAWEDMEEDPDYVSESLDIYNFYIKKKYRNKKYGKFLIREAIRHRWKTDGMKSSVYASPFSDTYFESCLKALGFKPTSNDGLDIPDMKLKVNPF